MGLGYAPGYALGLCAGETPNALYVLANCGLIELLKSLGDPTDFGE